MDRETIRRELPEFAGGKRLAHILGTEKECLRLAGLFGLTGEETEKLATAALLHDITKGFSTEEHISFMEKRGLTVPEENLRNEKTLHALTGAILARERYPEAVDDTVFSAILTHTTGKAGMTRIQKLLYLADYIEPTRTYEDCVRLREFFDGKMAEGDREKGLNQTLILSFDLTVEELIRERKPIHSDTVAARNDLIVKEKEGL